MGYGVIVRKKCSGNGQSYGLLQSGPVSLPGSYLEDPVGGRKWEADAGSGGVCPCSPLLQGARPSGVLLFPTH